MHHLSLCLFAFMAVFVPSVVRGDSPSVASVESASETDSDVTTGGTSTVTTTSAVSAGTCPTGMVCGANLRVCKNTAKKYQTDRKFSLAKTAPASSGTCNTYGATATVAADAPLSFTFEGNLVAANFPCPGSCVISARVDTFRNGAITPGTEVTTTLAVTGSGTQTTTLTATGGDGLTYTVPVSAVIACGDDD